MNRLFREQVVRPMHADPRTQWRKSVQLGYDFHFNRNNVIEKGLADFTHGYGALTADEKALLYCYIYMKATFFSTYANFRLNKSHLLQLLEISNNVLMFDVGCGPGTSILALSDLFPNRPLTYFGIDIADAMQGKTKQIWDSAVDIGLINAKSTLIRHRSWTDIDVSQIEQTCTVLVNFSYIFDSHLLTSKDVLSLAKFVHDLAARPNVKMLTISYTNSLERDAGWNYSAFKKLLGSRVIQAAPIETTVEFFKDRYGVWKNSQPFERELIEFK